MKHALQGIIVMCLLLFASGNARAQDEGQIVGVVTDPTGAVIPHVVVTATEPQTNFTRSAVTDASGHYELHSLRPTTYTISAEAAGFKKMTESGVRLEANQSLTFALKLEVGAINQSVSVEANAVQVDTTTSTLREVVDQSRIVELPLNGRNAAQLTTLIPGAVSYPGTGVDQGITKTFPNQPVIAANGSTAGTTSFQLDGNNNNDLYTDINQPFPAPDFLQEFSVQTSNYDSQYGGNAGAVVNAVTRSGTNEVHGSLFEFVRNGDLNARNFFAATHDPLKRNQYGASFGAPIFLPKLYNGKNKSFIFLGWQQSSIDTVSNATNAFVPTPDELNGNFSTCGTACAKAVKDPLTGNPFPGNIVPINRLDPVALAMSKDLPTGTGTGLTTYGAPSIEDFDEGIAKFDQQIGSNDRFMARYFVDNFADAAVLSPGSAPGTFNLLTYTDYANIRSTNATISETHIFSPTLLNEAHIGYVRVFSKRGPPGDTPDMHTFGMNINQQATPPAILGVAVTGDFSLGTNPTAFFTRHNWSYADHLTWVKGKHTISMGFSIDKETSDIVNQYRIPAAFTFSGQITGTAMSDFLLGRIGSMDQGMGEYKNNVDTFYSPYIQDDIKVNARLTVNLGLRYDPYSPWDEQAHRWQRFFPADYYAGVKSTYYVNAPVGETFWNSPGVPANGTKGDYNNFAPRVGFAYALSSDGKTSIRGGGGFFYDQRISGIINNGAVDDSPFSARVSYTTPCEQGPAPPRATCFAAPYVGANLPDPFPAALGSATAVFPTPVTVTTYEEQWRTPLAYNYNLTLEHQFSSFVIRAAYVGSRTQNGQRTWELNPSVYSPGASTATTNARRPFQPYGSIGEMTTDGLANYNSGQLSVNKRLSHGFTVQGSYVYSKSIDDYSEVMPWNFPNGNMMNYGPSAFDHTQRWITSYVWMEPNITRNRALGVPLNGWQFSGIETLQTGQPLTIVSGLDNSLTALGSDRAILTGASLRLAPAGSDPTIWFNAKAFAVNPIGTFGTLGKGTLAAPAVWNWDMSGSKDFKITERFNVQFRAEFFNVFNHTQFAAPGTTVNSASSFGRILAANDPRILQLALKMTF